MSTANTSACLDDECTIGNFIAHLAPSIWNAEGGPSIPTWPPDMFAIVASLLNITGAYCKVVATEAIRIDWTPRAAGATWSEEMQSIGKDWRNGYSLRIRSQEQPQCPALIAIWWQILLNQRDLPLCACIAPDNTDAEATRNYWILCRTLFNLMAASDEACAGMGFPELTIGQADDVETRTRLSEWFLEYDTVRESHRNSRYGTTLCKYVHPSRVRVLPKLHTPRTGMTLRSLSLHLALCPANEAKITWDNVYGWGTPTDNHINLLIVPWPMEIQPRDIVTVQDGLDGNAHLKHKLFAYNPTDPILYKGYGVAELVKQLLVESSKIVGEDGIHGIVLPETAVTDEEYNDLKKIADEHELILIAGIRTKTSEGHGRNQLGLYVAFSEENATGGGFSEFTQHKHHRWFLDANQIHNYGLASRLHPDDGWWEAIEIAPRTLRCVALRDWFYLCALICEDLARQDPMASAVRAIGPSLLIALLMDGPQLSTRWPSRYATVLADDPGTSVLTVTNLGMVKLSCAMRPSSEFKMRRTIALWKDSETGQVEIDLPQNCDGTILCLTNKQSVELSADGREDHRKGTLLVLGGVHYITCPAKA